MKKVMVLLGAMLMLGCNNGSNRNAEVVGKLVVSTAASSPTSKAIPAAQDSEVLQVQFQAQDSAVKVAGFTIDNGNTAIGGGSAEFDRLVIKTSQGVLADINPVDFPVQVMFGEPLMIDQDSSAVLSVEVTPKAIAEGSHRVSTALGFYLTMPTEEILASTESGRNDVPVVGAVASDEFWVFRTVPKVTFTASEDLVLQCGLNEHKFLGTIEVENPLPSTTMVIGKLSMKLAGKGVETPFTTLRSQTGQLVFRMLETEDDVVSFYPLFGPWYIGGGRTSQVNVFSDVMVTDCSDEAAELVVSLAVDDAFSNPLPGNFESVDQQSNWAWTDLSYSGIGGVYQPEALQWANGFGIGIDNSETRFTAIPARLNPQVVGTYTGLQYPHAVAIKNIREVLLGGSGGMQVVRTHIPTFPYLAASLDGSYNTFEIAVSGSRAYIDYNSYTGGQSVLGLGIVDITSNGFPPRLIGAYDLRQNVMKLEVAGDLVFAAMAFRGLLIFNVSDPAAPTLLGQYSRHTSDWVTDVVVDGSLAYVAYNNAGLDVLDVADPTNPQLVGNYHEAPGLVRTIGSVELANGLIYAGSLDDGLRVIDVADPTNPQLVGRNPTVKPIDLKVVGRYLFTTFFEEGLKVTDVADPTNPIVVAQVATGSDSRGIAVQGRYCYVADRIDGLRIVDLYSE